MMMVLQKGVFWCESGIVPSFLGSKLDVLFKSYRFLPLPSRDASRHIRIADVFMSSKLRIPTVTTVRFPVSPRYWLL